MGVVLSKHIESLASVAARNDDGGEQALLDVAEDVRELEAELRLEQAKVAVLLNSASAMRELACRNSVAFTRTPEYAPIGMVLDSSSELAKAAQRKIDGEEERERQRREREEETGTVSGIDTDP